jgi:integrase/recombinase XerD
MNHHYQRILQGFKEWLLLLNYADSSASASTNQIKAFFEYLEQQNTHHIAKVKPEDIQSFYGNQKQRISTATGTLLTGSTLNNYIRSLQLLSRYVQETEQAFIEVDIPNEIVITKEKEVLTIAEITQLYKATNESIYGLRERAILGIYYGCGLRSNEGLELHISDVLLEQRMLYVRKGKKGIERYVPFTERIYKDLKSYLNHCRPQLLQLNKNKAEQETTESFLLNNKGTKTGYGTLSRLLKTIQSNTGNEALQNKRIGLHHLRHSIATHLLQQGMELEDISYFLGHKTMRSTQVYTHIAALIMNDEL